MTHCLQRQKTSQIILDLFDDLFLLITSFTSYNYIYYIKNYIQKYIYNMTHSRKDYNFISKEYIIFNLINYNYSTKWEMKTNALTRIIASKSQ